MKVLYKINSWETGVLTCFLGLCSITFFLEKTYKITYTTHKRIVLPAKTENNYRTTQACFGKVQK